jgi:hypothetical protein
MTECSENPATAPPSNARDNAENVDVDGVVVLLLDIFYFLMPRKAKN